MDWIIPLSNVTIGEEEVRAAARVLRSGWLTQGEEVAAFERAFAERLGAAHALAVCNGTAALHLAYAASGLQAGDEFIVPALTFIATLNAGCLIGARPVLADCVSEADLTLSVRDVASKITPRTRLIVAMPYGGFCPDMPALAALAADRGIPLVEDACHAPLAEIDGRCLGTWGVAGAFSFFGNKNLATGEGGMVVVADDGVAARIRRMRSHGMTTLTWDRHRGHAADYDVDGPGCNYRMDEIHAAIGRVQLDKLPDATRRRTEAAERLRAALEALAVPGLRIPFSAPRGHPVHHLFVVLLPPGTDRAQFRRAMAERGIQTSMHYPLPHRFTAAGRMFAPGADHRLPVAEALSGRLVTLPMGPHLDAAAVAAITEAVGECLA